MSVYNKVSCIFLMYIRKINKQNQSLTSVTKAVRSFARKCLATCLAAFRPEAFAILHDLSLAPPALSQGSIEKPQGGSPKCGLTHFNRARNTETSSRYLRFGGATSGDLDDGGGADDFDASDAGFIEAVEVARRLRGMTALSRCSNCEETKESIERNCRMINLMEQANINLVREIKHYRA